MSAPYIPPALRRRYEGHETTQEGATRSTGRALSDSVQQNPSAGQRYSLKDIEDHYWPRTELSNMGKNTLHDSAASQGELVYVLLFHTANPFWDSERTIFVKSNLDLLPRKERPDTIPGKQGSPCESSAADRVTKVSAASPISSKSALSPHHAGKLRESDVGKEAGDVPSSKPIAIFNQLNAPNFVFAGFYRIKSVRWLEPHSPELIDMLKRKWEPYPEEPFEEPIPGRSEPPRGRSRGREGSSSLRTPESWQTSLRMQWAEVEFREVTGEDCPKPPAIQRKSVKQLLAESRGGAETGGR